MDKAKKDRVLEVDIQVRFADVDSLNHVNNVNMQYYFDIGKTEFFDKVMEMPPDWRKVGLVTVAANTSFMNQTKFRDKIYVETKIERVGSKSITFFQRILERDSGELKAECRSVMVAFDFIKQESILVPRGWVE